MHSHSWQTALKSCADPHRARHMFQQLKAAAPGSEIDEPQPEQARILCALFSGSQASSQQLLKHPEWLEASLEPELLQQPRHKAGLLREIADWILPLRKAGDYGAAFGRLRHFKQREMLRIAARDLAGLGDVATITREISDVADVCLGHVFDLCRQRLTEKFGQPHHQDAAGEWLPTEFCVLGMGKLGGQELNYSSDVDVLFVYSDEGSVFAQPPRKGIGPQKMSSHLFYKKLAEDFIAEVSRLTPDGALFRIDLRLRPEGDAGPLVRSLASYENYYAQWGQTWERMMLIKARCVGGDIPLGSEFLETIQPFRYPRSLGERILKEVAGMKERIENEVVKSGELERNVKLGFGGIREIEFVVQALQLLNAGRLPFLQSPQTLPTLRKLVQYELLSDRESRQLAEAYVFLRVVEHRLQMENNLQTHTIPNEPKARERLARLSGFRSLASFETTRKKHTKNVRTIFDRLLRSEGPSGTPQSYPGMPLQFDGAEGEWKDFLGRHRFQDVEKSLRMLREFAMGPGFVHVSPRTTELAFQLLPRLFALCAPEGAPGVTGPAGKPPRNKRLRRKAAPVEPAAQRLSDPDRVVTRLDSFVSAYGARAMLFETWASNPSIFELLLLLFDRSEFLAEIAIRTPDLVDQLVLSGYLRRHKTAAETLEDLRHGHQDADQRLWIRQYHQAELMRIGLRDILGLADFERNLSELSALADACLEYGLEVVLRENRLKKPPFAIVGLGKLGGRELNYGSDLDILFVADSRTRNLPGLQKMAVRVMDLLSTATEMGVAFHTDARLRPDGEKGLLVNTLNAFEEYYRHRAQLWEIQTLTRIRPIAGDARVGEQFQELAGRLADFKTPNLPLAAYREDWKTEIFRMRERIAKERTPAGKDDLAIKTGVGGLVDAEFIAQTWCLENGWQEANTLTALERGLSAALLPRRHLMLLIDNYRKLRRVEGILRRWSYEGEVLLPDAPAPYYRVAVRCGFETPEAFAAALTQWRCGLRQVFEKVFQPKTPKRG